MGDQLMWRGVPVPWVARWTGEVQRAEVSVGLLSDGSIEAFYQDGNEVRDELGVLWMREGLKRSGEPEFGQVSVHRQRACMLRRKCQVCGNKIEGPVIRWLIDPRQLTVDVESGVATTTSPPTCDPCIELALRLCPAMMADHRIAKVLDYYIWGVSGTAVRWTTNGAETVGDHRFDYNRDYSFSWRQVIAKQQVVAWTKWRME